MFICWCTLGCGQKSCIINFFNTVHMASNYGRGLELLLLPLPYCIAVVDTRFEIVEGDSSILTAALGTIMVACICLQNGMRSE